MRGRRMQEPLETIRLRRQVHIMTHGILNLSDKFECNASDMSAYTAVDHMELITITMSASG